MTVSRRFHLLATLPVLLLLLLVSVALPPPAAAQAARGTLRGRVVDAASMRPLPGVQISLPGTGLGSLTNASGQYLLINVPAQTHTVRAQLIGYGAAETSVTINPNETQTADFQLAQAALALDEVVVTGTAGAARRREVGNSIAQIDVADINEPIASVEDLLTGRVAGVTVMQGSGMAGSGAQIRLRGSTSISQSNQPLIYIDGVRAKGDAYKKNVPPVGYQGRSGNVTASPLDDINPDDIERVEVIKGAAATTLYGTEASAGVIQIFTKRGRAGSPRWSLSIDQGINRLRPFAPDVDLPRPDGNGGTVQTNAAYLNMEPFLRDGYRQLYSLSVGGGSDNFQYFVSGQFDNDEGVLPLDEQGQVGVRGNFTFTPIDGLQLLWTNSYTDTEIANTPAGNNAHGLTLNVFRAERNYFGNNDPELISTLLNQEITTGLERFVTGLTATYAPSAEFTNRFTIGYDYAGQDNKNLRPYGFIRAPGGIVSNIQANFQTLTLDYAGSYKLNVNDAFVTTLSFGGQSVANEEAVTTAYGEDFPGPGVPTVSGASKTLGFEERLRVINAGVFGQALLALQDKYFLTLGMRVDGNSAFGSSLGLQAYPKASVSYVLSEEPFWSDAWGQVKLRAAYGQAGRAPGAFDAARTWQPVSFGGQPAFIPRNLGNSELGPERTAETEVGFDAAFLNNRVSTEFTYYYQRTTDALFSVRRPLSAGFVSSQLENVGSIENKGIELGINATVVNLEKFGLDLGTSITTNHSKILDLGDAVAFASGGGWNEEGGPVMAARGLLIRNPDEIGPADSENDYVYGPQQPTLIVTPSASVRLPYGLQLSARGEYQGGAYIDDGASYNALQRAVIWPTCAAAYPLVDAGRSNELTAWQRTWCVQSNFPSGQNLIYPKDFFKLRDVTLRVPLGSVVPRANNASLALSLQNWFRWRNDDFLIFDPEMIDNDGFGDQNNSITEHIPPAASFVASFRVTF